MTRTNVLCATMMMLGLALGACAGSIDDHGTEAHANALDGALHGRYQHVDLPGTCHEFETLSLDDSGSYRATLASGSTEHGRFAFASGELTLTPAADSARTYSVESDDAAIQLTHGECAEVLQLGEDQGCSDGDCDNTPPTTSEPDPACAERTGGALVTFDVHGETLRVWSTNGDFIKQARELIGNTDFQPTPMFERVIAGYDACSGREWSVDAEKMSFGSFATEVCDGVPSYLDKHRDSWIKAPGNYCPWGPRVVAVDQR